MAGGVVIFDYHNKINDMKRLKLIEKFYIFILIY